MALQITDATVGIREDLSDALSMISPHKRPFMSNIGRADASAVTHEWQLDRLDAADDANAAAEGDDPNSTTVIPTQRWQNQLQIIERTADVSETLRAVDTAGRADELDHQVMKRLEEVGNDCEARMLSVHGAGQNSGSNRSMAGAATWLWENEILGAGVTGGVTANLTAGLPTPINGVMPTTSVTDVTLGAALITETQLKDCIGSCWDNGGNPTLILANRSDKVQMSDGTQFAGRATTFREVRNEPTAIIGAADLYISDFGEHYIVAGHFMPKNISGAGAEHCYVGVFDTEKWKVSYLRPMQSVPLAKTGDAEKRQVICEVTLQCTDHYASGKVGGTGSNV